MKFTIEADALSNALSIVTKALSTRSVNTVLQNILIHADATGIALTCSDEKVTIRTEVDTEVAQEGRGLVQGRIFPEIIRKLAGKTLTITMKENCEWIIDYTMEGKKQHMRVVGMDAKLFPALPVVDGTTRLALPQGLLRDMIHSTEFAIAADDPREMLTGGYLEVADGTITMVGLDGFRMALMRSRCADVLDSFKAIIPGKYLSDIAKLLEGEDDDFVTLVMDKNRLHIETEKTEIFLVLISGEYIDYRRLLPKSFATEATIDSQRFRECVERMSIYAREGKHNLLIMRFTHDRLIVEAHSESGDGREVLDIEGRGEELDIAFNVRYIVDIAHSIETERMIFRMNDPLHPCIVVPEDDEDYVHLVLPVRTSQTVKA